MFPVMAAASARTAGTDALHPFLPEWVEEHRAAVAHRAGLTANLPVDAVRRGQEMAGRVAGVGTGPPGQQMRRTYRPIMPELPRYWCGTRCSQPECRVGGLFGCPQQRLGHCPEPGECSGKAGSISPSRVHHGDHHSGTGPPPGQRGRQVDLNTFAARISSDPTIVSAGLVLEVICWQWLCVHPAGRHEDNSWIRCSGKCRQQ